MSHKSNTSQHSSRKSFLGSGIIGLVNAFQDASNGLGRAAGTLASSVFKNIGAVASDLGEFFGKDSTVLDTLTVDSWDEPDDDMETPQVVKPEHISLYKAGVSRDGSKYRNFPDKAALPRPMVSTFDTDAAIHKLARSVSGGHEPEANLTKAVAEDFTFVKDLLKAQYENFEELDGEAEWKPQLDKWVVETVQEVYDTMSDSSDPREPSALDRYTKLAGAVNSWGVGIHLIGKSNKTCDEKEIYYGMSRYFQRHYGQTSESSVTAISALQKSLIETVKAWEAKSKENKDESPPDVPQSAADWEKHADAYASQQEWTKSTTETAKFTFVPKRKTGESEIRHLTKEQMQERASFLVSYAKSNMGDDIDKMKKQRAFQDMMEYLQCTDSRVPNEYSDATLKKEFDDFVNMVGQGSESRLGPDQYITPPRIYPAASTTTKKAKTGDWKNMEGTFDAALWSKKTPHYEDRYGKSGGEIREFSYWKEHINSRYIIPNYQEVHEDRDRWLAQMIDAADTQNKKGDDRARFMQNMTEIRASEKSLKGGMFDWSKRDLSLGSNAEFQAFGNRVSVTNRKASSELVDYNTSTGELDSYINSAFGNDPEHYADRRTRELHNDLLSYITTTYQIPTGVNASNTAANIMRDISSLGQFDIFKFKADCVAEASGWHTKPGQSSGKSEMHPQLVQQKMKSAELSGRPFGREK